MFGSFANGTGGIIGISVIDDDDCGGVTSDSVVSASVTSGSATSGVAVIGSCISVDVGSGAATGGSCIIGSCVIDGSGGDSCVALGIFGMGILVSPGRFGARIRVVLTKLILLEDIFTSPSHGM